MVFPSCVFCFLKNTNNFYLNWKGGGGNLLEMPTHNERNVRISIKSKLARHHPAG